MNLNQNISSETFEQIERYLLGQMTAAEKQSFEQELAANKEMQDSVDQVQLLILGVKEGSLSADLNRFHNELPATPIKQLKPVRYISLKRWLAVASVIFILVLGSWFLVFKKSANEKLYATYFQPDPGLITAMSTTDNYVFDRAMVDYKTGKYSEAITAWKGLLQKTPQSDTLNYFIGAASLANGNTNEAIVYLKKVTSQQQSYFLPDAYWYLGLALLKERKKEEAIAAIQQSNHPQKEELLQALK